MPDPYDRIQAQESHVRIAQLSQNCQLSWQAADIVAMSFAHPLVDAYPVLIV